MIRKIYTEMPHILLPGATNSIDLEIEDKTAEEVIELIKKIAGGIEVVDKYGRVLKLIKMEDRVDALKVIQNSKMFNVMMNKFTVNEQNLISAIFALI